MNTAILYASAAIAALSAFGAAADTIGAVSALNRDVDGTPPQADSRNLIIGDNVVQNERIDSSPLGSGQFLFLDQTSLTFTPANWDTPQTVNVTGVDDDIDDGTDESMPIEDNASQNTDAAAEDDAVVDDTPMEVAAADIDDAIDEANDTTETIQEKAADEVEQIEPVTTTTAASPEPSEETTGEDPFAFDELFDGVSAQTSSAGADTQIDEITEDDAPFRNLSRLPHGRLCRAGWRTVGGRGSGPFGTEYPEFLGSQAACRTSAGRVGSGDTLRHDR